MTICNGCGLEKDVRSDGKVRLCFDCEGRRRRKVAVNWCAYNEHGIRVSVVFPVDDGWGVAGYHSNPYAPNHLRKLVKFETLGQAKETVHFRNPLTSLTWKAEEVQQ